MLKLTFFSSALLFAKGVALIGKPLSVSKPEADNSVAAQLASFQIAEGLVVEPFATTEQLSNPGSSVGDGQAEKKKPNVVLILVDDMGYGDPKCFNPKSRLKTPAIDRLAREGLMFTDAHAPHSTCIASRYGLLTGTLPAPGQSPFHQIRKDHLAQVAQEKRL